MGTAVGAKSNIHSFCLLLYLQSVTLDHHQSSFLPHIIANLLASLSQFLKEHLKMQHIFTKKINFLILYFHFKRFKMKNCWHEMHWVFFFLSEQTCHLYQVSEIGQSLQKEDNGG